MLENRLSMGFGSTSSQVEPNCRPESCYSWPLRAWKRNPRENSQRHLFLWEGESMLFWLTGMLFVWESVKLFDWMLGIVFVCDTGIVLVCNLLVLLGMVFVWQLNRFTAWAKTTLHDRACSLRLCLPAQIIAHRRTFASKFIVSRSSKVSSILCISPLPNLETQGGAGIYYARSAFVQDNG